MQIPRLLLEILYLANIAFLALYGFNALVLAGLEDTERPLGAGAPPRPPLPRPGRSPILLALLLLLLLQNNIVFSTQ